MPSQNGSNERFTLETLTNDRPTISTYRHRLNLPNSNILDVKIHSPFFSNSRSENHNRKKSCSPIGSLERFVTLVTPLSTNDVRDNNNEHQRRQGGTDSNWNYSFGCHVLATNFLCKGKQHVVYRMRNTRFYWRHVFYDVMSFMTSLCIMTSCLLWRHNSSNNHGYRSYLSCCHGNDLHIMTSKYTDYDVMICKTFRYNVINDEKILWRHTTHYHSAQRPEPECAAKNVKNLCNDIVQICRFCHNSL